MIFGVGYTSLYAIIALFHVGVMWFAYYAFNCLPTAVVHLQSIHEVPWLPCQFVDEHFQFDSDGLREARYEHRNAVLQFGQPEDSPVHPEVITFLITGSKVDMRRYVEGELDSQLCEVRRHNTSVVARWPGHGAQEHDTWFTCTLRHKGLFVTTTFLRHSPSDINAPRPESGIWAPIADRETVSTSAVMVISSSTPTVKVGLVKEQMLNCEFAVDHKSPHITVEWRLQRTGEPTTKLLSYSGHTNKVIGSGDASFKIPLTKRASEGTYICSVYVPPLYGSVDIALQIMEPPHVSLTVSAELSLAVGEEQKVVCEAATYYPLDVRMEWLKESTVPGASRMPEVLKQVQLSSHRRHLHDTYSLSAFFLLKPSLQDSGYRYTCRVEHASLQYPIRKSFTLTVTESGSLLWYAVSIVIVIVILVLLLYKLNAMREAQKRKPY